MQDSYHTRLHPLYRGDPGDDRILAGVLLATFLCNPEYLVANRVFQKEYLYKNYEWVSSEQLFWLAVRDLPGLLHWPRPPFDGWYKDKVTSIRIQEVMKPRYNPIFEVTEDYNSVPFVDISSLLFDQDVDPESRYDS